jgi:hypothetical protein
MRHRNAVKVNILQASNIDSRHALALGVSAFAVGMHTALGAKAVLDHMLVKRVAAGVSLWREQLETLTRHKPHQGAFALANRTVTCHSASRRALDFKFNLPTMAACKVFHGVPPGGVRLSISSIAESLGNLYLYRKTPEELNCITSFVITYFEG